MTVRRREQFKNISILFILMFWVYIGSINTYGDDTFQGDVLFEEKEEHQIGDVVGSFKKSATQMKLGEKTIPTYEMGNELCFVIEDLKYYGGRVTWHPMERLTRTTWADYNQVKSSGTERFVKTSGHVYYSDIKVFVDGIELPAYNIGGYSLVKFSDLTEKRYVSVERAEIHDIHVGGIIRLPEGVGSPKGGLVVKPVFYYAERGRLVKYLGESYAIDEGESNVNYEMILPSNSAVSTPFYDINIYGYMGYEIETEEGQYIHYDLEKSSCLEHPFLKRMSYYQDVYSNVNIELLPKQEVSLTLNLEGDVFGAIDSSYIREISVAATEVKTGKRIVQSIYQNVDQKYTHVNLTFIENQLYTLSFSMTSFGSISPKFASIPPQMFVPYYYNQSRILQADGEKKPILANEQNASINLTWHLPNIVVGDARESKWRAKIGEEAYEVFEIDGELYMSRANTLLSSSKYGALLSGLEQKELPRVGDKESETKKVIQSTLCVSNNETSIPVYLLMKKDQYEQLVKISDMEKIGFKVQVDELNKTITILN
ncbi:hypothetical protein [Fusibacter sp. 3D3]|uniref:hypothetical protein n=1 Tax=Fusibacter sp. 3D3 TaxID=1048380 RepID=UPI000853DCD9|nr:hypothetical protein [Fusibacter sp. 3D3]GAU78188.1 hypothetical protein F3D3_2820 [Fusibacter sp. 3D3]